MRDRLVDAESEKKFDAFLKGTLNSHWSHRPDIHHAFFTTMGQADDDDDEGKDAGASGATNKLKRVVLEDFQEICKLGLISYEREEKELGILLFTEILEHLVRVDRVLARDGGSLLLIGRSGVGRATATQIVAHMHHMEFNTPIISRGYTTKKFFETVRHCFERAGVEGEHTVLYIEDHQMEQSFVLETVNSILSSGDVPGLYTHEELAPLLGARMGGFVLDFGSMRFTHICTWYIYIYDVYIDAADCWNAFLLIKQDTRAHTLPSYNMEQGTRRKSPYTHNSPHYNHRPVEGNHGGRKCVRVPQSVRILRLARAQEASRMPGDGPHQ